MNICQIKRALLSVTDKRDIVKLATFLHERDVEILSTGGTMRAIAAAAIPVIKIDDFTGSPEVMDGRVKTLHPRVHGGILFRRHNHQDSDDLEKLGGKPIDLVVVNLYEFVQAVEDPDTSDDDIIEKIDIGGPSILRSAAKNHTFVTVVTDPEDYDQLISEMTEHGGTTYEFRRECATRAFAMTADYDAAIKDYFELGKPEA